MRPSIISTIYRKEIREVLRDKRMLYLVILMPFFLYPVLFLTMGSVGSNTIDKINTEKVSVFVNPEGKGSPLAELLAADTTLEVKYESLPQSRLDSIRGKSLAIILPAVEADSTATLQSQTITIYGDNTQDVISSRRRRIAGKFNAYGTQIVNQRLTNKGLAGDFIQPIKIEQTDTASDRSAAGAIMGRMIPIMLLLFIFIGCIYIAIDTTAGEKERRTLQTIYTTPVSTNEIIAGKFLAVATVGIVSAFANLGSLLLSMQLQARIMGDDGADSPFQISLAGGDLAWLILLVILATVFLAALSMGIVLLANSYKEAQSYVTPLMMIVLIPAIMASMPGMELTTQSAMIPMFNICLAMAAIFKGTYSLGTIGLVALFALIYGLVGLWLAGRTFGNESVVTGEKVSWRSF
ncbi:MAG: ABC transporter permease, partial [Bacteroidota bacterium]